MKGIARPAAAALALAACAPAEPPPISNAVLVTLDTTRADALEPYGQERPVTPVLARLAREGVVFERVASASPSTLPSHATLFTGHYPFAHGVRSNAGYVLSDSHETLAERLAARGWRTAAEVAAPVLDRSTGLAQGFADYRDTISTGVEKIRTLVEAPGAEARELVLEERPAADVTRWARRFLAEQTDAPFFLWLHYFDPHREYVRRPEHEMLYREDPYLAEVRYTDAQLGAVIEQLEELGLRERTLVVVVADHGEGLGEHGEDAHSFFVYESTIRVPLILWGPPGLPQGRRIETLVRTVDVAPTILALLGLEPPADAPGRSLAPLIDGSRAELGLPAYGESVELAAIFRGTPLRYLRAGDWKYLHQPEPELYDLASDPDELDDRAAEEPARVAALRGELERLLAEAPGAPADAAVALDPARAAQLAALGYLGAAPPGVADLDSIALEGRPPRELLGDVKLISRAEGFARIERWERAEPILRELRERHPDSATIVADHAQALRGLGRGAEAAAAFERALELAPCASDTRVSHAELLGELGRPARQLAVLKTGVGHCSESLELLNNYAWSLATHPDPALRDGSEAVRAARRALALGGEERPEVLDTVAAAHAEAGDFEQAVEWSRRALALAEARGEGALAEALAGSLRAFEAGRPLRTPPTPGHGSPDQSKSTTSP